MAKRKPDDRRERVQQMRREQQQAERRRTVTLIIVCALVGVVIIGAAAWVPVSRMIDNPASKPMSEFGVAAAQAGLGELTNDSAAGVSEHMPTGQKISYQTVPPSAGPHWAQPAAFGRKFYDAKDRPALETLVHNLEHGYTIVWYDETIAKDDAQLEALRNISRRYESSQFDNSKKLIIAPWKAADGAFPEGKHIAFTHWSLANGRRQYSEKVSGEAIEQFMKKYPASDAPEPQGA